MERTIPHLDEGTVQAIVHGELTKTAEVDVARHAADCAECRERIAVAREEDALVRRRLSLLDVPPPAAAVADVIRASHRQHSSGRWRRAAAIALLAGGTGIAWAIPSVRAL